jgi:hypothetical protein
MDRTAPADGEGSREEREEREKRKKGKEERARMLKPCSPVAPIRLASRCLLWHDRWTHHGSLNVTDADVWRVGITQSCVMFKLLHKSCQTHILRRLKSARFRIFFA